jgi:hypothetical protein
MMQSSLDTYVKQFSLAAIRLQILKFIWFDEEK